MSITKTLRASALAASLAIALGMALTPTPAAAAAASTTGQTTFSVILQPTTLLYYYSAINLTVPSSALLALAGGAPAALAAQGLTATGGTSSTLSATAAAFATSAPGSISAVGLTLSNVWAVRSITTPSSGTTKVSVSFSGTTTQATATLSGSTSGSSIALSSLATSPTSFNGTGLGGAPQVGNVTMTMDLSNAKTAQTYSGATIYITATST
ncbi:hypothetical protein [Metallibacterium sp.]|uniref:hypothetical protein n=1 Tax=Metallibacterium sp. TaxID=2940281 RepID=UPI0026072B1A|nr:hypothetical protein [Metallibacterium sp.]